MANPCQHPPVSLANRRSGPLPVRMLSRQAFAPWSSESSGRAKASEKKIGKSFFQVRSMDNN